MPSNRVVEQLPSPSSVTDPTTRAYLEVLYNAWLVRNGNVGHTDDERFITKGEFDKLAQNAFMGYVSGAAGGVPGGPPAVPPGAGPHDAIATRIVNSILYGLLGARIPEIRPPYERLTEIDAILAGAMTGVNILKNKVTRITEESATSVRDIRVLNTSIGQYDSLIFDSVQTQAGRADRISTMKAAYGSIEAAITNINSVTASSTSAAARALYAMTATMGLSVRTFFNLANAGGTPIAAAGDAILTPRVNDQWFSPTAFGGQVAYTRRVWNGNSWQVSSLVNATAPFAGILHEQDVRVTRDTANASVINNMWSAVTGALTQIQDGATTVAGGTDGAFAQKWTQLQTSVFENDGTVRVLKLRNDMFVGIPASGSNFAWPGINNLENLRGAWTIRMEQNGVVGGFGLVMEDDGTQANGIRFDFGIRANRFWIADPDVEDDAFAIEKVPFAYEDGTVYIKDAAISRTISSDNYVAGSTGWQIRKAPGNPSLPISNPGRYQAEFDSVWIRGLSRVGRLVVDGASEGSCFIANNSSVGYTVQHNEQRKVMVTLWLMGGAADATPYLSAMTDDGFTIKVHFDSDPGTTIGYRYW